MIPVSEVLLLTEKEVRNYEAMKAADQQDQSNARPSGFTQSDFYRAKPTDEKYVDVDAEIQQAMGDE